MDSPFKLDCRGSSHLEKKVQDVHDDVCITKKNGFAVAILKDHAFAVPLCWHRKSSYLGFIIMFAAKRIISLRSQSRAPTKWPARWLLINYLIFLSFRIFKPPCYISRLAYTPIFIQVCEPVSQKVCGTVEVAVPRYYHHHQTTSNLVHSCTIFPCCLYGQIWSI